MKRQLSFHLNTVIILLAYMLVCTGQTADAQNKNIKNDIFWNTKDGSPIYSQGGGIFRFADPKTGTENITGMG